MADITEYKCPACGGAMEFDSKSQKMKCPYCDTEMDMDEYEKLQQKEEKKSGWQSQNKSEWSQSETEGMRIYVCQSCGGEIVADESTGATQCPFCGNKVTMKGQFAGDLKPDYVIPFKLDKKDAKNAYLNHLKGKKFLPKCFKAQNHIDEIKGLYVPFWIFDIDSQAQASFNAQKIRIWRQGDTEYTETRYFDVERGGDISFDHIPVDSSKKMDDILMESIEPYDFKDAVEFKAAYLAGYMADRYDVKVEETIERAKERVKRSAEITLQNTVKGYDTVSLSGSQIDVDTANYWYTLYPVWILNTTWKGQKYVFAMNGQTGKLIGNLPTDGKAFWLTCLAIGSVLSAIVVGITYLFI